jgi:hypothetical protein
MSNATRGEPTTGAKSKSVAATTSAAGTASAKTRDRSGPTTALEISSQFFLSSALLSAAV